MTAAQKALHPYVDALLKADKNDEAIALMTRALINYPDLSDPPHNWEWLYPDLIDTLGKQGQTDEALRWARLRFAVTSCEDEALLAAGHTLSTAWGTVDHTGQQPLALVGALRDPARANPLQTIKNANFKPPVSG